MICGSAGRRTVLELDPATRETVIREMKGAERSRYYFGENVGLLVFRPWYRCVAASTAASTSASAYGSAASAVWRRCCGYSENRSVI